MVETASLSNYVPKEVQNLRAYEKIMDEQVLGKSPITASNSGFKDHVQTHKPAQKMLFDGGAQAQAQQDEHHAHMLSLNRSAMGSLISEKDIEDQFKFLTDLLIQQYKDPDPEQETDHAKNIQTMVALMTAGQQVQNNRLMQEQNSLIRHSNRISTEQRVGMKAQYQDMFFEVRDGQESVPIYYRLGRDAEEGKVLIRNEKGQILQEINLPSLKKGDYALSWDRSIRGGNGQKVGEGIYFIEFQAMDKDKNTVEHIVELEGVISDIDSGEDGHPEYYVGGVKVDGRISKISRNDADQKDMKKILAEIRDKESAPITGVKKLNTMLEKPILENNPILPNFIENQRNTEGLKDIFNQVATELNQNIQTNLDLKI